MALRQALPPEVGPVWDRVGVLAGTVDAAVSLSWQNWPEVKSSAALQLHQVNVRPEAFPYVVEEINGRVRWADSIVTLDSLQGTHGRSPISVNGQVHVNADQTRLELAIDASDVSLDEDLRAALPAAVQEHWEERQPRGAVDARVILLSNDAGEPVVTGSVVLHGCSALSNELGRRIDDISGLIRLKPDLVDFESVTARMGRTRLRGDGVYRTVRGDSRLQTASVVATDLQLNDAGFASLSPAIDKAFKDYAPRATPTCGSITSTTARRRRRRAWRSSCAASRLTRRRRDRG